MTRRLLLLALFPVLLSACADSGLTATGSAAVTTGDAERRLDFPAETRLDGSGPGRFTGNCVVRRMRDGAEPYWGVTVEVRSGGSAPGDDFPLQRLTLVQNTAADPSEGHVEVELGATVLRTVEGACSVELRYVLGDGSVGLSSACEVIEPSAERRAQVSVELDLAGCDVES